MGNFIKNRNYVNKYQNHQIVNFSNGIWGKFDSFMTSTQRFAEHYGQITIGLTCHAIFVTEDNGQWRYAIKAFTVQANDVYNFTLAETVLKNQAQLEAAINALP